MGSSRLTLDGRWLHPQGRSIIALYDGSEKTSEKDNDIKRTLEKTFQDQGFRLVFHDINRGLPAPWLLGNARGIVTWYRDGKMKNAANYCKWLAMEIKNGKKVIIMDNFGAYQDSKTDKWVDLHTVNEVFNSLGVTYKAQWTGDAEKLELASQDNTMVGTTAPIDFTRISHYYLFSKISSSVKDYLTVKRKDLENSESSVIFSHPNGGMAFSRYFMTMEPLSKKEVPNIDLPRFIADCLEDDRSFDIQKALIVWDRETDLGTEYLKNIVWTLEYAKIDYAILELKDLQKLMASDLKPFTTMILCTKHLSGIKDPYSIQMIKDHVGAGGGLLVVRCAASSELNEVLGIKSQGPKAKLTQEGMKLTEPFFPGAEAILYARGKLNSAMQDITLSEKAHVLARSLRPDKDYPEGVPIAWLNLYGKGRAVCWSSDFLQYKHLRGILLQTLLLTQPVSAYSLANIENISIDDCPQPLYNDYKEPIGSTMKLTDTEFCLNVWWNDMRHLSQTYGIQYSFYTIFDYGARMAPPFDSKHFYQGKDGASLELARRVLVNNFELGFHGYNHEQLVLKSWTKPGWRDRQTMKQALLAARALWERLFPETERPWSYVAPMDLIDKAGKQTLHEVFPSIRVISTVTGMHNNGSNEREFGQDPDVPEFFDMPRVSAGYLFTQPVKNDLINYIALFGVWTHFVHPDDIFGRYAQTVDEMEGEKPSDWPTLFGSAESMFSFVHSTYPWLRNMSTKDASIEFERYFDDRRTVKIEKDAVVIGFTSGSRSNKYFCVKINDGARIVDAENCRLVQEYKEANLYIYRTKSSNAIIKLTRG